MNLSRVRDGAAGSLLLEHAERLTPASSPVAKPAMASPFWVDASC